MNIKSWVILSFISSLFLILPSASFGDVFCVQNQFDLNEALDQASQNNQNDTLRFVQGAVINDFHIPKESGFLIKIESGYSVNCAERMKKPQAPKIEKQAIIPDQQIIEPQVSTTGPYPPEGIEEKTDLFSADVLADATEVTILGVPGYVWRHGCGPTAVGMVAGYWDAKGCDNLPSNPYMGGINH